MFNWNADFVLYLDWNEPGFSSSELFEVDRVHDRGPQQLERKRPVREAELGLKQENNESATFENFTDTPTAIIFYICQLS